MRYPQYQHYTFIFLASKQCRQEQQPSPLNTCRQRQVSAPVSFTWWQTRWNVNGIKLVPISERNERPQAFKGFVYCPRDLPQNDQKSKRLQASTRKKSGGNWASTNCSRWWWCLRGEASIEASDKAHHCGHCLLSRVQPFVARVVWVPRR